MAENDDDHFGPIDFLVVEFPSGQPTRAGFELLLAQVDEGRIRILDLELVTVADGVVNVVGSSGYDAPWMAPFAGANSSLLDSDDLQMLARELSDGALGAVVVYEELSILEVMEAWEGEGAHVVLEGHLSPMELEAALDSAEA